MPAPKQADVQAETSARTSSELLSIPLEIRLHIITLIVRSEGLRVKRLSWGPRKRVDWKCDIATQLRNVCRQLRSEASIRLIRAAMPSVDYSDGKGPADILQMIADIPDPMFRLVGYLEGKGNTDDGSTEVPRAGPNLMVCCIDVSDYKPELRHVTPKAIVDSLLEAFERFESLSYCADSFSSRLPPGGQMRVSGMIEVPRLSFGATVDAGKREIIRMWISAYNERMNFHRKALTVADIADFCGHSQRLLTNKEQKEKMQKQLEEELAMEEDWSDEEDSETDEEDYETDEEDDETEEQDTDGEMQEADEVQEVSEKVWSKAKMVAEESKKQI